MSGPPLVLVHGAISNHLRALVLYEPSLGLRFPPGSIDRLEARIEAGDYEGALIEFLADVVGLYEDEIADMRAAANWPERVAIAPTIVREARIDDGWRGSPTKTPAYAPHRVGDHCGVRCGRALHRRCDTRRPGPRSRRPRSHGGPVR